MMPQKPSDGNWLKWANALYPFDPDWERHLLTRTERPRPGSEEQLDDLRGLRDRDLAANLAQLLFYSIEHDPEIAKAKRDEAAKETEKDRRRLIRVAKLALDGKLGETRDERDGAQATAQHYLRQAPENCSDDDLHDWEKMHQYAKRVANGESPPRPRLAADIHKERQQARELDDINDAVDASRGGRPATPRREQQQFVGW